MLRVEKLKLDGVVLLEPRVFGDARGWSMESYSQRKLAEAGIDALFVQDNHSMSQSRGVLRGLHYQAQPMTQAKLVRCSRGALLDVVVDLRRGSETFLQWEMVELSEENHRMIFVPRGFAHGAYTLCENTEIQYKLDNYYSPEHERGIRWNDPDINISWGGISPILSEKDAKAPFLKDVETLF